MNRFKLMRNRLRPVSETSVLYALSSCFLSSSPPEEELNHTTWTWRPDEGFVYTLSFTDDCRYTLSLKRKNGVTEVLVGDGCFTLTDDSTLVFSSWSETAAETTAALDARSGSITPAVLKLATASLGSGAIFTRS